jgi:type I restriction enzyme, S subunit
MARSLLAAQIPIGWEYNLLDKYADRRSGHTPSKSFPEYWDGGIKWISLADSYRLDKGYIYETDNQISEEGIRNSSTELHPAETVVLSRDAGIGKSGVMAVPMAVSQHFIAWRCDNDKKLNSWFLYNWLQLNKSEFERQAVGSTIKTIGLPYFKKLRIAIPPYEEQKKIAQILSTWDKAIATTEKLLEKSHKQKQALMQQLLTGKKRHPEFKSSWITYVLEELEELGWLELGRGNVISKIDIENKPGDNPIYSSSVKNQGLMGSYAEWMFDEELISWSVDGGGNFFYRHKHKFSITNVSGWMRVDSNKLNYKFMAYQLSYLHEKLKFDYQSKAHPSVIRKIYKLNIPTLPEQEKIASILFAAELEITSLEMKIKLLREEKKALMQQLLTGKRRVRV